MKVNILMSTYNGQQFLAEQIRSIQEQSYIDWTLFIRDDGSSDRTREIIKDFVEQDQRIHFIDVETDENLGVIKSFHRLVHYDTADFYFFSDQDDVWLPNKLEVSLKKSTSLSNKFAIDGLYGPQSCQSKSRSYGRKHGKISISSCQYGIGARVD